MGLKSKFKKAFSAVTNIVTNNPISSAVEAVTDNKYLGWAAKPVEWMVIPGALHYDIYCLFKEENKDVLNQSFEDKPIVQKLNFDITTPRLYPPFKDWVLKQGDAPLRLTHTPRFRELDYLTFQVTGNSRYMLIGCTRAEAKNQGFLEGWFDPYGIVCGTIVKAAPNLKLVGWHYWDDAEWIWSGIYDYENFNTYLTADGLSHNVEETAPWASPYSILCDYDNGEDWRFQMLYFIGPENELEATGKFRKDPDPSLRPTALFAITIPHFKDQSKGKIFKNKKYNK